MPSHAFIKAIAAVVVTTLGTMSPFARASDAEPFQNVRLVLPSESAPPAEETATERVARLRSGIAASGVPFLDDEQLREEIQSRRSDREQ